MILNWTKKDFETLILNNEIEEVAEFLERQVRSYNIKIKAVKGYLLAGVETEKILKYLQEAATLRADNNNHMDEETKVDETVDENGEKPGDDEALDNMDSDDDEDVDEEE